MQTKAGEPLVSVIISTYKRPTLLKRAIESVLAQSMGDFELLVVDDCSPDNTEEVVKSFTDPRIKYLKTESNFGFDSQPKNLGIKQAKGQYISFLDDDDFYRVDALKILSVYLKESECEVVYGDYLIETEKGKKKQGWSIDFNVPLLSRMNYISMCVVIVKREALLKVGGFDEEIPKFKDWNLWLRLQKSGCQFMHVPIIVSEVTTLEDSISNKYKVDHDGQGNYLPTFFNPSDCKIWPNKTVLGERKPLKVAIYTLTWNRLEYTKMMGDSLYATADYDFDWFVIDQGSTDGTVEWLKTTTMDPSKLHVEFNDKNVGLAEGWNQALESIKKAGGYDIVVKIDNDAKMLTRGWLKAMVELFECNRTLVLSPYVEGLEKTPGGVMRTKANSESPYFLINDRVLGSVPNIGGICFAHSIDLIKDWKFDATYKGNKDFLLSRYARAMGYSCFYMEEFRIWHIDGTTGQQTKFPEYFKDNTNDSVK